MTISLSDLLAGQTSDQVLVTQLALAQAAGFPATAWQETSVPRTFFEVAALVGSDLTGLIAAIAAAGFLESAEGAALDLLAQQLYNLQRKEAVFTRGRFVLSDPTGFGGFAITDVGQIWIEGAGRRFRNLSTGVLVDGGALELLFEAEHPGEGSNLPPGVAFSLVTSIPGIGVAQVTDPGGWITQQGVDRETDGALRIRCRARWGELSRGTTEAAWLFWALSSSPEITRASVGEAIGNGTVSVYVAGPSGAVSGGALAACQALLTSRRPQCVRPTAYQATEVVYSLLGSIRVRAGEAEAAKAAITAAVVAFFAALPLGGVIYRGALEAAIQRAHPAVINAALGNPGEVLLLANEVAVPSLASVAWVLS